MNRPDLKIRVGIVAIAFLIPIVFAIGTNHVFEDYLITYKSSKNLALGNGLVYHPGERVHTFTSPLGVLVPAALCWVTGNHSDLLVIWLFRIISAGLLAAAALLVYELFRRHHMHWLAILLGLGLVLSDVKTIDFSINGMETAFLVFFTALMLYAWLAGCARPRLLLGIAWAGLMWTRPDGFVYAGGFAIAAVAFGIRSDGSSSGDTRSLLAGRWHVVRRMTPAFLLAVALYLPWVLWAWSYYGSPVPNTIIAKGLNEHLSFLTIAKEAALFPFTAFMSGRSVQDCYMPVYAVMGGWPMPLAGATRLLTYICIFHWIFPIASPVGRMISLTACAAHVYLSVICPNLAPWYLPGATLLTTLAFAFLLEGTLRKSRALDTARSIREVLFACPRAALLTVTVLLASNLMLIASLRQLAVQQAVIESGHRKEIGKWLAQNAKPGDSVFMECLGYIGYYSGLKTLDYPGLSSPEVVEARRDLPMEKAVCYGAVIDTLKPSWLVLRPHEIDWVLSYNAGILNEDYSNVQIADVSETVNHIPYVPGRRYLQFDDRFAIYHRKK